MSKLMQYNGVEWIEIAKNGYTPIKNIDYFDGKDGHTPTKIELEKIIEPLIPEPIPGKDGSPDTPLDIVEKLNTLKEVLNPSVLKNVITKDDFVEGFKKVEGRFKAIDQRWHGGGLSKVSTDSTLTGNGTPSSPLSVSGVGDVLSVTNSDGTLTISPTVGAVIASLNLGHANNWTGQQTFSTSAPIFSTMTAGSVLFAGTSGLLSQDNTNFFWDITNKWLGLGGTPGYTLDVRGAVANTSVLHFAGANADSGGYITSAGANNFFTSAGSAYIAGAWTAKATGSVIIGGGSSSIDGAFDLFMDTGLTIGNTFAPTAMLHFLPTNNGQFNFGNTTSAVQTNPLYISLGGTYATTIGSKLKLKLYEDGGGSEYGFGISGGRLYANIPAGAVYSWHIATTQKMIMDVSGNLGLGVTTPGAFLDLGGAMFFDTSANNNIPPLSTTSIKIGGDLSFGTNRPYIGFNIYNNGGYKFMQGSRAGFVISEDPDTSTLEITAVTAGGAAGSAATMRTGFRFNSAGQAGFGTNVVPIDRFDVNADQANGETGGICVQFDSPGFPNIRGGIMHGGNGSGINSLGGMEIFVQGADNTTAGSGDMIFLNSRVNSINSSTSSPLLETMRIKYNGNVGIANTNPGFRFDIAGTSITDATANIHTSSSGGYQEWRATNDQASGSFTFGAGGSATGDIFQNAGYMLARTGLTNFVIDASGGSMPIIFYSGGASAGTHIAGGSESMRILSSGFVGIETASPNSYFHVNASAAFGFRSISALRTLDATDYLVKCTGTTNYTVTLPTAVSISGRIYIVKNSGTATITLATTSAQTIDGASTVSIGPNTSIEVMSDNANWIII